jgi:hypothetical protein
MEVAYTLTCFDTTTIMAIKNCIVQAPGDYPRGRCLTRVGYQFIHKSQTRLIRLAREKYSSLLGLFLNYVRTKFYNIGPRSAVF